MSKFKNSVINVIRQVPYGMVASYGQIALFVGTPRAAIQVGQVLHHYGADPKSKEENFPWWRIINNAGRISIKGHPVNNADMQKTLLVKENITVNDDLTLDIEKYRWRPDMEIIETFSLDDEYIEAIVRKYLL